MYEIVRIRVIFPKHSEELDDFIELETWIPWDQVYGKEEELEGDENMDDGGTTDDGTGDTDNSAGGENDVPR